jgi:hypothetical protein
MDTTGGQADALEHLDPVSLAAAISKLPPNNALVAAARVGVEVADARWERREAVRQASKDVAAAASKTLREWDNGRGWANSRIPHDELERRRVEIPQQRSRVADEDLDAACDAARAACAAATQQQDDDGDDAEEGDQPPDRADALVDES